MKKKITEIACATSVSSASMTGAVAAIAEPPQMEEPTPTRIDVLEGTFSTLRSSHAMIKNINKFTQNSLQAVQNCEKIAADNGNQELAQEHLLYALLTQDDSLILKLFEKMNIQGQLFINSIEQAIGKRPKVQGGQAYVGQDLNNVLIHAEDEAKRMGDEYVSVEHLFLCNAEVCKP